MFDNIGRKIKNLATACCWIGIILFVTTGIVLMAVDETLVIAGVLVAAIGSLLSWIGSFVLYGYGQLIENSDIIAGKINSENTVTNADIRTTFASTFVPRASINSERIDSQNTKNCKCELCDAVDVKLIDCKIVDNMGTHYRTRYRKICSDCMSKHKATPINKS